MRDGMSERRWLTEEMNAQHDVDQSEGVGKGMLKKKKKKKKVKSQNEFTGLAGG
jgi:hypothetical protein